MSRYTDLTYLIELTDNDKELILQSLERYLTSSPEQTEKLVESSREQDCEEIHNSAHSLFATTQIVGLIEIAQDLKDIQRIALEEKDFDRISQKVEKVRKVIKASYQELQDYMDRQNDGQE